MPASRAERENQIYRKRERQTDRQQKKDKLKRQRALLEEKNFLKMEKRFFCFSVSASAGM